MRISFLGCVLQTCYQNSLTYHRCFFNFLSVSLAFCRRFFDISLMFLWALWTISRRCLQIKASLLLCSVKIGLRLETQLTMFNSATSLISRWLWLLLKKSMQQQTGKKFAHWLNVDQKKSINRSVFFKIPTKMFLLMFFMTWIIKKVGFMCWWCHTVFLRSGLQVDSLNCLCELHVLLCQGSGGLRSWTFSVVFSVQCSYKTVSHNHVCSSLFYLWNCSEI